MSTPISHQDDRCAQLALPLCLIRAQVSKARKSPPARTRNCSSCGQPLRTQRGSRFRVSGRICKPCCNANCECGELKQVVRRIKRKDTSGKYDYVYAPACPRCMDLDGLQIPNHVCRVDGRQDLISTLRVLGRSNWDAIRLSIPYLSERALYRGMEELISTGRVKRHQVDDTDKVSRNGVHIAVTVAEFELRGRPVLHTGLRN